MRSRGSRSQLYFLLDSITDTVTDDSIASGIVGYSVAQSLSNFDPDSFEPKRQPRTRKEILQVYEGLRDIGRNFTYTTEDEAAYSRTVLKDLRDAVTPQVASSIVDLEAHQEVARLFASDLYLGFVKSLAHEPSQTINQALIDRGRRLIRAVKTRGPLVRAQNRILAEDYTAIERTFS